MTDGDSNPNGDCCGVEDGMEIGIAAGDGDPSDGDGATL